MLQQQINYWNYVETKRHNEATELAANQQAEAALSQARTAAELVPIQRMNAETNRLNYSVNLQNAGTNSRNADINARNAATNERNAAVNEYNADINAVNAATNRMRALNDYELGLGNLAVNQQNADTNAYNAETSRKEYTLQAEKTPYEITKMSADAALSAQKKEESKAQTKRTETETKYIPAEKTANIVNTWVDSVSTTINTLFGRKKTTTSQNGTSTETIAGAVSILAQLGGGL